MIRIVKPQPGPVVLSGPTNRGPKETQALRDAFDQGERDFEFKSGIYGAKSVKNALIKAQHKKCCFCESKLRHVAHGDVEHFRPKGGTRQKTNDPLTKPGYYWLAYTWSNLFLSCQICNQRFKGNLFPLADASTRAASHHDDLTREQPLFLDPAADDPRTHIEFRQEVARPVGGSERGQMTITALGLNRDDLIEMRRDRLGTLQLLNRTARIWRSRANDAVDPLAAQEQALLAEYETVLAAAKLDSAEYAAMARAALA